MPEEYSHEEVFPLSLETLQFLLPAEIPTAFQSKRKLGDNRDKILRVVAEALDATSDGVVIFDVGSPNLMIQYVNGGFERLTGYTRKEALNSSLRFLNGPETAPDSILKIQEAVKRKLHITLEILHYRKDGAPFWDFISLTPVSSEDLKGDFCLAILSDVSPRVLAEDQLRETMRLLEKSNLELTQKNKIMEQNLVQAARVQRALLPLELPQTEQLSFHWLYEPSEQLAGDSLNIFRIDKNHIGVYLLDVTGHGTAAALLAVSVSRMLQPTTTSTSLVCRHSLDQVGIEVISPAEVANQLNRYFPWEPEAGQFFTMVYGIINTSTLEFRYVCAGHPSPLYVTPHGDLEWNNAEGVPIGLSSKPYVEQSLQLLPGGRLLLFSDGITDVMNEQRELWGQIRLCKALQHNQTLDIKECLEDLVLRTNYWCGNQQVKDDRTLVGVDVLRKDQHESTFGMHF